MLEALSPSRRGYQPDFVSPPPDRPRTTLARELDRVRATPRARILRELDWAYPDGNLPAVLEPIVHDPRAGLDALAAQVTAYAQRVLVPDWPRVEAAVEAEFSQRGRRLAREGASAAFSDVHVSVSFADDMLLVDGTHEQEVELNGRGLMLVPSVFVWPDVWSMTDAPWQPAIVYAPGGVVGCGSRRCPSAPLWGGGRARGGAPRSSPRRGGGAPWGPRRLAMGGGRPPACWAPAARGCLPPSPRPPRPSTWRGACVRAP